MSLTTQQLCHITGLTMRQIDHWIRQGYVRSDTRNERSGTGIPRTFSGEQVRIAKRMAALVRCGFTPSAAAHLAVGDQKLLMEVDLTLSALRVSLSATSDTIAR